MVCPGSGVGAGVVVELTSGGDKMGSNHIRAQSHSMKLPERSTKVSDLQAVAQGLSGMEYRKLLRMLTTFSVGMVTKKSVGRDGI